MSQSTASAFHQHDCDPGLVLLRRSCSGPQLLLSISDGQHLSMPRDGSEACGILTFGADGTMDKHEPGSSYGCGTGVPWQTKSMQDNWICSSRCWFRKQYLEAYINTVVGKVSTVYKDAWRRSRQGYAPPIQALNTHPSITASRSSAFSLRPP